MEKLNFSFESVEDQPTFLPPKFTKRGLYRAYLGEYAEDECLSWTSFHHILNDINSLAVSNRQWGLCDACFIYCDTLRTLKNHETLDDTALDYAAHLSDCDAILQKYRASKATAKLEWVKNNSRFVVLAFDYARQLGVPHLGEETTEGFWASKKALDVNLFEIVNEGAREHGLGTPYLVPERVKSGSDTVCSMLHHYLNGNAKVWAAQELHLWSDSCTGQNKINIVMAYLMLLVHNRVYDVVDWRFFAVGHSKFHPDRLFGAIRSSLHQQTVLTTPQLKAVIDNISGVDRAVLFDAAEVHDWHGATAYFHAVQKIHKTFYYGLRIERVAGKVVLQTFDAPNAVPARHTLLKAGRIPPTTHDLSVITYLPAPALSEKRREDLKKLYWDTS